MKEGFSSSLMSLAVIIPVYNAASQLRETLLALSAGTRVPEEVIVADDASTDDSAAIAAQMGARVLSMPRNCGPAACRNAAAQTVAHDILIFLDADTCVHADTIARIEERLSNQPELSAVVGAYDDTPRDPGWCSQCRNLAHCYVHRSSSRKALAFWSGCGAVRRDVFFDVNGFDERYRRPSVEDIELGYRMTDRGHRILLDPSISVMHTKRWTFVNSLRTDLLDRGIPWTVLLLERGNMPNDLNLTVRFRLSTACTGAMALCCLLAFCWPLLMAAALGLGLAALWPHRSMFAFIRERSHARLLTLAVVLFMLQQLCNILALVMGGAVWAFRRKREPRRSRIGSGEPGTASRINDVFA